MNNTIKRAIGYCILSTLSTIAYERCACSVSSQSYFSPASTPRVSETRIHTKKKAPAIHHYLWRYTDLKTSTPWLLVRYIKPTGKGAYMTAPYYTFTKSTAKPLRKFVIAWTFKNPATGKDEMVYEIKKMDLAKPHNAKEHEYKWVNLNDIRKQIASLDGSTNSITVVAKDGSRIWIDKALAQSLIDKKYIDGLQ